VLFLDEPTTGVDPVGARELRGLIASLTAAGKTVLLTTHYMFEADSLCDRIAVIANGEIVAEGTPQQLKAGVEQGGVVEVEVFGIGEEALGRVESLEGVLAVTVEEQETKQLLIVQTAPGSELTHVVLAQLQGVSVGRVSTREPTLEDAYVQLVTA
jgi:ABC-2 type transport system ATP-binding protein